MSLPTLWTYVVGRWEPSPSASEDRVACAGCGRPVFVSPFPDRPPVVCPTCSLSALDGHA